jgi:quercetin dioxygenase-like cupin family protein
MKPCDTCEAALDGKCLSALADQPTVTEFTADGLFVAHIEIAKVGTVVPQHSHRYEHLTFLAKGSVRVARDGFAARDLVAPATITVAANTKHLFETLTDDVLLLCIHNTTRSGTVEVIEEHQIACR